MKSHILIEVDAPLTAADIHKLTRRIAIALAPHIRAVVEAQPEGMTVTTRVPAPQAGRPDPIVDVSMPLPALLPSDQPINPS